MLAKKIPEISPDGKRSEVAAAYGLTVEEFNKAYTQFVEEEGYNQIDGHECQNLHEWLTYEPKENKIFEPFQKSDEWNN